MTPQSAPKNPRTTRSLWGASGLLGLLVGAVTALPASAQPVVGTVASGGWRVCAAEGQTCQVDGRAVVRYGVDGRWSRRAVNGSVVCGNDAFGDPAPQVRKVCEVRDFGAGAGASAGAGTAPAGAGSAAGWTFCAAEGETCQFRGFSEVRFGDGTRFTSRGAVDAVRCDTEDFGDPAYGVTKYCEVRSSAALASGNARAATYGGVPPAPAWRYCAAEDQVCRVSGRTTVRFGDGQRHVERQVNGGEVACSTQVFGDPAFGVVKHCEVQASGWANGSTTNWGRCADEGQRCAFSGQAQVRYGSEGRYTYRDAYGGVDCGNATFGTDPSPGRVKSCEIRR